jgi:alkylation response protein AidB-like acyl-CoA dehydrogenase
MDFTYTAEQELLRDSVSRAAQGGWKELVALGLTELPFEGSVVDLVAVAEVLGAHLVVEPWFASAVLAGSLVDGGLATRIAAGEIATLAHEEGRGTAALGAITTTATGGALTGEKKLVLHGADAEILLVTALLDRRPALFSVDPTAAARTPFTIIDGRPAAHLRFDATPATLLTAELPDEALDRAILVLCADAVGAMGELVRRTAEYARTREQFGVPIATFQTVAHRLADMRIAYLKARSTLLYTTAQAEAGHLDVRVLKAQVGRLGRRIGEAAIQTHGGVGMTDELPIGHLHKRILVADTLFGPSDHHLRALGAGAH